MKNELDKSFFRFKLPFNIELLLLKDFNNVSLKEVKSKEIFEQNSTVFKKDGLFSTEIFGEVGSVERFERLGYIDFHVKVLHPLYYKILISMKSLYKDILEGKKYAIFDEKLKDFIESTPEDGKTGYEFFVKHVNKIKFEDNNSLERKKKIEFLSKYKINDVYLNKYLVIPAGLRDYIVTESGKVLEDSINNLYRRLLSLKDVAKQFIEYSESEEYFVNNLRVRGQKIVTEIYDYIENILSGKKGFITGKYVRRRVFYGSRNVLTAPIIEMEDYDKKNIPLTNETAIGIYQFVKSIPFLVINKIKSIFLDRIITEVSKEVLLINKKTLRREYVDLTDKSRKQWATLDGLEDLLNKLKSDEFKSRDIEIDNHYLYLIYDKDDEIIVLDDIESLPEKYDKNYLRPMKYVELAYLSVLADYKKYPMFVTRYPVTGFGSIYPSWIYLKTTVKGRYKKVNLFGKIIETYEYPNFDEKDNVYFNSISVDVKHLDLLGGDYDGDKINITILWEEESIEELKKYLNSVEYYLSPDGKFYFTNADHVTSIVLDTWTS